MLVRHRRVDAGGSPPLRSRDPMTVQPYKLLVRQIVTRWRGGDPPDTLAALQQHAELQPLPAAIVELAFEEFHLRRARGEPLTAHDFCSRFPRHAAQIHELIQFTRQDPRCTPSQLAELATSLHSESVRWPVVGERWEGMRIIEEMGHGAFARVYLAEELREGKRPVVVKVSMRAFGEAQIQGTLFHPHIVPVLTATTATHHDFQSFVMPYLGRRTIDDLLGDSSKNSPLTDQLTASQPASDEQAQDQQAPETVSANNSFRDHEAICVRMRHVARIGLDLVEALRHMHSRGFFHNDVKPANILLTRSGRALLLDFNLATKGHSVESCGGTLPYMAPERLALVGLPQEADTPQNANGIAAELFSLAAVLYQALLGKLPYGITPRDSSDADQAAWLIRRQLDGLVPTDRNSLHPAEQAVLEWLLPCLDCRVDRRLSDAAEFTARGDWLLAQLEQSTPFDTLRTRLASLPWRNAEPLRSAWQSEARASGVAASALSRPVRAGHSPRRWWSPLRYPSVVFAVILGALLGAVLEESAWTTESQPLTWDELTSHPSAWMERVGRWRTYWDPLDAEGWVLLGDGRLGRFEPQAASACYAQALRLGFDSAALRNNLGLAYCLQGRLEHAESAFASALERDPALHAARENRLASRQTWEACQFLRTPATADSVPVR